MIQKLTIVNYALIEQLEIDFNAGFSVITGETGAGKSIILGALSMILGERAESRSIKNSALKCVIEGEFDISSYTLAPFFEEHDLEYDPTHTILRREIAPSGKSRAFVNDTPVSLALLKELGSSLIDIHSQHQNLLIGNDKYQMGLVDALAKNRDLLATYRHEFRTLKELQRSLKELQQQTLANQQEEDYLRFQLTQLQEMQLKEGEQEGLEREQELLSHAEEIKGELYAANQILSGDEGGVESLLKMALAKVQGLSRIHPDMGEVAERLHSNYIDIKDVAAEMEQAEEAVQIDPNRLMQVEERLNAIYQLQQKHQLKSVEELLALAADLELRLGRIEGADEQIAALETEIAQQQQHCETLAEELSQRRHQAATAFAQQLTQQVTPLGMPNLRFEVAFTPKVALDEQGSEQLQYLFSANKNQPLMPVEQVASGGEISRLMLCIKSIVADAMALPTIIFDEVDTGVSGDIADKMAGIMQQMGHLMQVLTITHLPQVAAKGETHYRVYKKDNATSTETHLTMLNGEERIEEIAHMLSGSELTEAARTNAQVLLKK